ncbi:dihydroneopterin aldolase [Flindersiella endophytica]
MDADKVAENVVLDRITLRGIRVHAHHGVFPSERAQGQPFVIDVVLGVDTSVAAATDDLANTVDYAELAGKVAKAVGSDPVDLIETVARRVADVCLESPRVADVEVTVHKPQAPVGVQLDDIAVTIHRSRT